MNKKQRCLACAALICLSGLFGQANAKDALTAPYPSEVQAAPEPSEVQAAPEPSEVPAVPEPSASQVVPEPSEVQAAPEALNILTAPRPWKNQAAPPGSKISLAPLPVDIYLLKGQKPTVAFTTPCIMIEKMTNGFPPIMAFENLMFTVIGNVNDSEFLPVRLEPVCI